MAENTNTVKEIISPLPGKRCYAIRGTSFTVHEKYQLLKAVGVGAYGVVTAAIDTETGQKVAMKKVSGVFDNLTDAKRVLREIRLMRALDHDNILSLYDLEAPATVESFNEIYMASPLYDKDLSKILDSSVELSDEHNQYFVYQILCALKYLHSASVMHRDLKPANILIQESCDLAICDFGLARYVDETDDAQQGMTEYVVTRWYRAPELVLTSEYTNAVDLWALGCIMGDLLGRKVLFPGKDFKNQVEIICGILGKPTEEDTKHVTSSRARKFLSKLPDTEGVDFSALFPNANPDAIDLMEKLLKFNPDKRMTAEQALEHPYVREFHDAEFEACATDQINMSQIEPRNESGTSLSKGDLRRMMLAEIFHYRPDAEIFKNNPELVPQ
ncbi:unnamed protein product [Agarophyton chilense]